MDYAMALKIADALPTMPVVTPGGVINLKVAARKLTPEAARLPSSALNTGPTYKSLMAHWAPGYVRRVRKFDVGPSCFRAIWRSGAELTDVGREPNRPAIWRVYPPTTARSRSGHYA